MPEAQIRLGDDPGYVRAGIPSRMWGRLVLRVAQSPPMLFELEPDRQRASSHVTIHSQRGSTDRHLSAQMDVMKQLTNGRRRNASRFTGSFLIAPPNRKIARGLKASSPGGSMRYKPNKSFSGLGSVFPFLYSFTPSLFSSLSYSTARFLMCTCCFLLVSGDA
jgi:hypothetical protein